MTYREAVIFIQSYIPVRDAKWNKNFGLDKIKYLLEKAGNPHLDMEYIHVGGTSGKGSTATFIASILKESGYRVGLHVSPHIRTMRERMQINGVPISKERFVLLLKMLQPHIEWMEREFGAPPSYFEILLVLTFMHFKHERTDINVIEVGIGGKLDGTNVIDCEYQVVTNVGLDHMSILGDTKEEILRDKQEIIKKNSRVVTGIREQYLREIIQQKARDTGSELYFIDTDIFVTNKKFRDRGSFFDLKFRDLDLRSATIRLPGTFQIDNASLAAAICHLASADFPLITEDSLRSGLENAQIKGRMQMIGTNPLTIVDGAHNPDKVRALVESIEAIYPGKKFVTLFRYKHRKDIGESISMLSKISTLIIFTGSKRVEEIGTIDGFTDADLEKLKIDVEFRSEPDLGEALRYAYDRLPFEDAEGVLATGSLLIIDELMKAQRKL